MAKQKLLDVVITVNSVDLSSQISSVVLNNGYEDLDSTAFGDTAKRHEGGLSTGSLQINWKPDTDLSTTAVAIDAIKNTVVAATVKLDNAAISSANPEAQFNVWIGETLPFGGAVGSLYEPSTTWQLDTVVTYDTTP